LAGRASRGQVIAKPARRPGAALCGPVNRDR